MRVRTEEEVETISNNVLRLRKEQNITQEELAHRAGVAYATVARIERGMSAPNTTTLWGLAKGLGVSPETLLGKE